MSSTVTITKERLKLFESRFVRRYSNECWLWTGGQQKGVGYFNVGNNTRVPAHRVSYQVYRGPIPELMCVYRSCKKGMCVNPSHLYLGESPSLKYVGKISDTMYKVTNIELPLQEITEVSSVTMKRGRVIVNGSRQRPRCPKCEQPVANAWTVCRGCDSLIIWEE